MGWCVPEADAEAVKWYRKAVEQDYTAGRVPAYDGIACVWFGDGAACAAAGSSLAIERVAADESRFLGPGRPPFVLARGVEIPL